MDLKIFLLEMRYVLRLIKKQKFKKKKQYLLSYKIIQNSVERGELIFNKSWYLEYYDDVKLAKMDPIEHYLRFGQNEGRLPSLEFDPTKYKSFFNQKIENPLIHYLTLGKNLLSQEQTKLLKVSPFDLVQNSIAAPKVEIEDLSHKKSSPKGKTLNSLLKTVPNQYVDDISFVSGKLSQVEFRDLKFKSYINDLMQCEFTQNEENVFLGKPGLKIAVYTAVSGGYDTLKLPLLKYKNCDFFVFTDAPIESTDSYKIMPMPFLDEDTVRRCRYIKTHPHVLLPDYDYAIWLDMNISIVGDLSQDINDFINSKFDVGFVHHPYRNNIYDEANACINGKRDNKVIVGEQIAVYKAENFQCYDLIESNYMVLNLRSEKVKSLLDKWWIEIFKFSRRDQLSLNYVLSKLNMPWFHLHASDTTARNHPELAFEVVHNKGVGPSKYLLEFYTNKFVNPLAGDSFYKHKVEKLSNINNCCSVVICIHNALGVLKNCLESIVKHTDLRKHSIILVNDGSDIETTKYIEDFIAKHNGFKCIYNEVAIGYTRSANLGLKMAEGDLVVLLNSDTIVTSNWLEKFLYIATTQKNVGIISPLSNAASFQSVPGIKSSSTNTAINKLPFGCDQDDLNLLCEKWSKLDLYPRVPFVHGFCFAITRNCINKIGYLDENAFPFGYGEETDYCVRAVYAGFDNIIDTTTYIFHAKSQSFVTEKRVELMQNGMLQLHEKYKARIIDHNVASLKKNPILEKFRVCFSNFYEVKNSQKPWLFIIPTLSKSGIPAGTGYVRTLLPWTNDYIKELYNVSASLELPRKLPLLVKENFVKNSICIIQRDCVGVEKDVLEAWVKTWKSYGGKVIYEIDDDFIDYKSLSIKANISLKDAYLRMIKTKFFISLSDIVVASTAYLGKKISSFSDKPVFIVKNVLDSSLWNFSNVLDPTVEEDETEEKVIKIGYVGTPSHLDDMNLIEEAVKKIQLEFENQVCFEVIGICKQEDAPWGKVIPTKFSSYPNFVKWIQSEINWDIALIPLEDREFNYSKSNLKFLECAALNTAIVVSNVSTYGDIAKDNINCLSVNNTCDDWYFAIKKLIEDQELRKNISKAAHFEVQEKFLINNNLDMFKQVVEYLSK